MKENYEYLINGDCHVVADSPIGALEMFAELTDEHVTELKYICSVYVK